jgi:hypothetical protein
MKEYERKCILCSELFSVHNSKSRTKYCSKCRFIELRCDTCGVIFLRDRIVYNTQRKKEINGFYHSNTCRARAHRKKNINKQLNPPGRPVGSTDKKGLKLSIRYPDIIKIDIKEENRADTMAFPLLPVDEKTIEAITIRINTPEYKRSLGS